MHLIVIYFNLFFININVDEHLVTRVCIVTRERERERALSFRNGSKQTNSPKKQIKLTPQ